MDKLFIPDRINVGYQEREGTYTGRLAYVIYWDKKGVLRKETSWNSWRDGELEPTAAENTPTEGFVLNKGVGGKRSHWNHRNEYIRVYDPRGWEVEVSVANLLYVLLHCDCSRGNGLEGKFVYAWQGTELVLLPAGTEEYRASAAHTERQGKSIPRKSLVPGVTYTTKDGSALVFVGNYHYHTAKGVDKRLIFHDGKAYLPLKDTKKLAEAGEAVSAELPELTRAFLRGPNGSRVVRLFLKEGKGDGFAFEEAGWFVTAGVTRGYNRETREYSGPVESITTQSVYQVGETGMLMQTCYSRLDSPGYRDSYSGWYWRQHSTTPRFTFHVPTAMQLFAEMESGSTIRVSHNFH